MSKKAKKAGKNSAEANSKVWALASVVVAMGSATAARKGIDASWRTMTGKNPPENPADPDVAMREAVLWAAFSGAAVALVKMMASRKAAQYFVKSTGHLPGQLRADGTTSVASDPV